MIFNAALTTKIKLSFTINVLSSFQKARESGYIAA